MTVSRMRSDVPRSLGDYLLLGEIARGGMGVVYQAVHATLNRSCALKVIRAGTFASAAEKARFALEAEASAALDHPCIVRVRHAGEVGGEFFLEMELVEGGTLAERLMSGPLPARDAAVLVASVARAVEHAHDRGVLHRDLKPGNVLLDEEGAPRLTDFGLARLLDRESDLTRTLAVLGTPAYLAPELAAGKASTATTAADVYGLGAILYECLAGRAPYGGETPLAVLKAVQDGPPPPPSRVRPGLPRDLEIVVTRAMAREPADRLASARELADELERWLRGEPIRSRPVPWWEQLRAWARRRPGAAALAGVWVAVLAGGFVVTEHQRRHARDLSRSLLHELSLSETRRAAMDFSNQRGPHGLSTLARSVRRDPANPLVAGLLALRLEDRSWPRPVAVLPTEGAGLWAAACSPDGSRVVGAMGDGRLRVWRAADGAPLDSGYRGARGDWKRLVMEGGGRWLLAVGGEGALRVWPAEGGDPVVAMDPGEGRVWDAQFRPGESWLAVAREGKPVGLVDCAAPDRVMWLPEESSDTRVLAFDPQALVLALAGEGPVVRRWNLGTGHWEPELPLGAPVTGLSFGDAGRLLVVTRADRQAVVVRLPGGEEVARLPHAAAFPVRFNPGGTLFLAERAQASPFLFRLPAMKARSMPGTCRLPAWGLAYSRDGSRVLLDGGARGLQPFLFPVNVGPQEIGEPIRPRAESTLAFFLPNRDRVLVGGGDRDAVIWEINRHHPADHPRTLGEGVVATGFTPTDGEVRILRADGSLGLLRYPEPRARELGPFASPGIDQAVFSPGAAWVAVSRGSAVELLPVEGGEAATALPDAGRPVTELAFAPDGGTLAVVDAGGWMRLWSVPGRAWVGGPQEVGPGTSAKPGQTPGSRLAYSADGRWLGVAGGSGRALVIETGTGRSRIGLELGEPVLRVLSVAGGDRYLAATVSGRLRCWDPGTGATVGPVVDHGAAIVDAAISGDGRLVATAGADAYVRVWEVAGGRRVAEFGVARRLGRIGFVAGGRFLLGAGGDRQMVLWDGRSGVTLKRQGLAGAVTDWIEFDPARRWAVVRAHRGWGELVSLNVPDTPAPGWVPDLAEALAGERLREDGSTERIPPERYLELRRRLVSLGGEDYWHGYLLSGLLGTGADR